MELTQRLESSQEIVGKTSERLCPEQIGFLGICGTKHPVKKGFNKIGRDPQTCNIVLNLNSISRQHAVLNVLSSYNFMLMDLDSANKTKLQNKILDPYIPYPLRNGDTVQFGQVFGIFRLLEEDTDLPMTQALEIPETPVVKKHFSKINHTAIIPESPDFSDKDDSFIAPLQSKEVLRSSNKNFLKSSGHKILIQPGHKQIDNSISYSNDSVVSEKFTNFNDIKNFHEMDTQITDQDTDGNISIYDANTQLPDQKGPSSPNIYSMETQVPILDDVPGVNNDASRAMQIHDFAENKENNITIFNTDTQLKVREVNESSIREKFVTPGTSDDIILFDEIDSQPFEDNLESQAILPSSPILFTKVNKSNSPSTTHQQSDDEITSKKIKIINSSTDCDDFDIMPTQMILKKAIENQTIDDLEDMDILPTQMIKTGYNEDETDCENEANVMKSSNITLADDDDVTDCEDNFDECCINVPQRQRENLKTQVKNTAKCRINSHYDLSKEVNIQDQSMNILENMLIQETDTVSESFLKNKVLKNINTSRHIFKVPSQSPRKSNKNISKFANVKKVSSIFEDGDPNDNADTQEISEDMLAQKEPSDSVTINQSFELEDAIKIDEMISALSSQEVRDIVGVETKNTKLKRFPSDSSNCEGTPKKVTILQFMDNDLPNSQEIKTCLETHSRTGVTIYTSESETENDSQQATPILFKKKQRKTRDFKLDLSKKFDADLLPSRFSTRVKKPPALYNGFEVTNMSILKSNIITDPEEDIDMDIINENILRLKGYQSKNISIDNTSNLSITKSRKTREKETYCHQSISPNIEQEISENKGLEKKDLNTKKDNTITSKNNTKTTKKSSKTTKKDLKTTTDLKKLPKDSIALNISQTIEDNTEKSKKPKRTKNNEAILTNLPETNVPKTVKQSTCQTRTRNKLQENNNQEINNPENARKRILKRSSSHTDISDGKAERQKRIKITDNESSGNVLRRSTRQRSKKEETTHNLNNQSLVYSTSPQSMNSLKVKCGKKSPLNECRPATALGLVTNLRPTSARRKKTQFVLFTAFPNEEAKSKLENLGAVIVSDVQECTVVLTLQLKRTFKLLCAVGLGKPIVGPQWVQACVDNKVIVDPWLYLIQDEATEKRFHFNLRKSLVSKRNFLKGIYVSSTPSVTPSAPEMKVIVECSGGTWAQHPPNPHRGSWVVVTSHADKALWPALQKKGAVIVSTEFILSGVLQQHLEIDKNKLA